RAGWAAIAGESRAEGLTVHVRPRGLARLLRDFRLVMDGLELHLDPLRLLVQGPRVEFRMKEKLVDHLNGAGRGPGVRVDRMGLAEERDDVEVPLAALVQEDPRDPGDDALLKDGDVVLANHVHRLVRR